MYVYYQLVVTILDVNDVTPKFETQSYHKSVREDTKKKLGQADDRSILTISAKDDDEGDNAKIIYSITKGNKEGLLGSLFNNDVFYRKKYFFSRIVFMQALILFYFHY